LTVLLQMVLEHLQLDGSADFVILFIFLTSYLRPI